MSETKNKNGMQGKDQGGQTPRYDNASAKNTPQAANKPTRPTTATPVQKSTTRPATPVQKNGTRSTTATSVQKSATRPTTPVQKKANNPTHGATPAGKKSTYGRKTNKSKNYAIIGILIVALLIILAIVMAIVACVGNGYMKSELNQTKIEVSRLKEEISKLKSTTVESTPETSYIPGGEGEEVLQRMLEEDWSFVKISMNREEKLLFMKILAGECIGEETECQKATANAIANAINCFSDGSSAWETLTYENRYSCLQKENDKYVVYVGGELINEKFLSNCKDFLEEIEPVLTGEEAPLLPDSYWHYIAPRYTHSMSPLELQEEYGLQNESVIYGEHIFYSEDTWEKVNAA